MGSLDVVCRIVCISTSIAKLAIFQSIHLSPQISTERIIRGECVAVLLTYGTEVAELL